MAPTPQRTGLTLIEVLVVLAIGCVLLALALPFFFGMATQTFTGTVDSVFMSGPYPAVIVEHDGIDEVLRLGPGVGVGVDKTYEFKVRGVMPNRVITDVRQD